MVGAAMDFRPVGILGDRSASGLANCVVIRGVFLDGRRTNCRRSERKWLGGVALVGLTVVFLWHPFKPVLAPGEFRVTVLDVGQGQALVFETETATVVYDTGARWSDKMDGAKLALLPYLNRKTVRRWSC